MILSGAFQSNPIHQVCCYFRAISAEERRRQSFTTRRAGRRMFALLRVHGLIDRYLQELACVLRPVSCYPPRRLGDRCILAFAVQVWMAPGPHY